MAWFGIDNRTWHRFFPRSVRCATLISLALIFASCSSSLSSGQIKTQTQFTPIQTATPLTFVPSSRSANTAEKLRFNPLPLPDYLSVVIPQPGISLSSSENISLGISPGWLWEPGQSSDIAEDIVNGFILVVDDRIVPVQYVTIGTGGGMALLTDPTTRESEGIPGEMTVYAPVNLSVGIHVITVIFDLPVNRVYSYTWAVEIKEE